MDKKEFKERRAKLEAEEPWKLLVLDILWDIAIESEGINQELAEINKEGVGTWTKSY